MFCLRFSGFNNCCLVWCASFFFRQADILVFEKFWFFFSIFKILLLSQSKVQSFRVKDNPLLQFFLPHTQSLIKASKAKSAQNLKVIPFRPLVPETAFLSNLTAFNSRLIWLFLIVPNLNFSNIYWAFQEWKAWSKIVLFGGKHSWKAHILAILKGNLI